jgi:radical SAM superfamily enzyme YgiQ (UPF0313 family)
VLSEKSRKVVLFQPPYAGKVLGPPLGLLSLAGALRDQGYEPRVIDGALDADYAAQIKQEVPGALAFGVSLLTGPMIHAAIDMARAVKASHPELPIIFGGWHPSLLPGETLREEFVDIVVLHQGEQTLLEILRRLEAGRPLDLVAGCWFKRDGNIWRNPDRPAIPLASLPLPAYDLVNFDRYAEASGVRKMPYATSIGCPYACNYCTDMVFYNRRFNAVEAERVAEEMVRLVRRHRLEEVSLVDSNFLVDVPRAVTIAQAIVRGGEKFRWTFQASTDLLCRMTDEQVALLGRAGVSHIGFGTESASPEVLRAMNKRHQVIEHIEEAARKCQQAGIAVTLNLIFGYPGEEEKHRRETLRVMSGIASRYSNVTFSPNVFVPYPGIPIWPQLRELGVYEPVTLAEWSDVDLGVHTLPWLRGAAYAELSRGISYFLLANRLTKASRKARTWGMRFAARSLRLPLHWRLRHHLFAAPVELWISMAHRWLTVRRSLLTGQPLSRELTRSA